MRSHDIINDVEKDFDVEIHPNDIPDILCDGETCRHSECDCWDSYRLALEEIAGKLAETPSERDQ